MKKEYYRVSIINKLLVHYNNSILQVDFKSNKVPILFSIEYSLF